MFDQNSKSFHQGDRGTASQPDGQRRRNGGNGDFAAYAHRMHQEAKDSIASLSAQDSINGMNSIVDNNDTLFKDALRNAISRNDRIKDDLKILYSLGDDDSDNTNELGISKKREIKVRGALSRLAESPQHSDETIEKALRFIKENSTMRAFYQPTSSSNEARTRVEPDSVQDTDITKQKTKKYADSIPKNTLRNLALDVKGRANGENAIHATYKDIQRECGKLRVYYGYYDSGNLTKAIKTYGNVTEDIALNSAIELKNLVNHKDMKDQPFMSPYRSIIDKCYKDAGLS